MIRVRFHGRGGQGMKTASRILGSAAFHAVYSVRCRVEPGMFALKKAINGVVSHTYAPRRHVPVEGYLRGQGRYRHLFEPTRNQEAIQKIQEHVDRYWAGVHETSGAAR